MKFLNHLFILKELLSIPTIEIVSVDREKKIKIPKGKFPFWVRQDTRLISHRGLFQDVLNQNRGVIMHIGNMDMKNHSFIYFGSDLINWKYENEDESKFQFSPEHFIGVKSLLYRALVNSPISKAYFLTDIQLHIAVVDDFSEINNIPPETHRFKMNYSIEKFTNDHESAGLEWNTLYEIIVTNEKDLF